MAVLQGGSTDGLKRLTNLPPIASFTMMAWFNIVTAQAFGAVLGFGTTVNGKYYLVYANASLALIAYQAAASVTGSTLVLNRWYHIAMTVSGTGAGQYLVYLNGVLNITNAGDATNTAVELNIGSWPEDGNDFIGLVEGAKIWNRALTPTEIRLEMRQHAPVQLASLNSAYGLRHTSDIFSFKGQGASAPLVVAGVLGNAPGPMVMRQRWPRR